MKTPTPTLLAALVGVCLLAGTCSSLAADKTISLPPSQLTALDFTNLTFVVDFKGTNLTVFITSETRFFKNGKYAISRDLVVGETVRGTLREAKEGRHEAVRIYWGKPAPKKP